LIVGIVKPSPSVSSPAPRPPRRTTQCASPPTFPPPEGEGREGAQNRKTANRVRPRTDVFRHRGPRHRLRRRRGHALTSDSSMSEAASELHSSRPRGSQSRQKSLFFNSFFQ